MAQIILLGGGSIKDKETLSLDAFILSLTTKTYPKVLFIPLASKDNPHTIDYFKELYSRTLKSEVKVLTLFNNPISSSKLIKEMEDSDIIYFGGGNTGILVSTFLKDYSEVVKYLRKTKKILVGMSAGGIFLTQAGLGDSQSYFSGSKTYNFKMVEGIGLTDFTFCPHYNEEDRIVYNDFVSNYPYSGIALEENTMAYLNEGELRILKSSKERSAYLFVCDKRYLQVNLKENETYEIGFKEKKI